MSRILPLLRVAAALAVVGALATEARAERLRLDAARLFERGVVENLRLSDDRQAIEVESGVLIEDDGPAAGYSYRPNEERLTAGVAIRKQLVVAEPRAARATLLIGGSGEFQFEVNGRPCETNLLGKSGNYWQMYSLPVDALRSGVNDVVIRGQGQVWIARDDEYSVGSTDRTSHPNRSAKSVDNGQTWNDRSLGKQGDVDGEYYVRLFLDQRRPTGKLTLSPLDVSNLSARAISPPLTALGPIRLRSETDSGPIAMRVRSSPVPTVDAPEWSSWQVVKHAGGEAYRPAGRYLQIEIEWSNDTRLRGLEIDSDEKTDPSWIKGMKLVESDNRPIVRSSIPFAYEPLDHPDLKRLREQYGLDTLARDATSELELIARLARWSATRFPHGGHLRTAYPPWNALEILRPHDDGTPVGGFCQQFNIVFLQACESFGIVGRAVSIGPGNEMFLVRGGHEVVELWSNQFRKWIYVDGNLAWYAVDAASKVPLSLLELHDRQLAALHGKSYPPIEIIMLAETGRTWSSLTDWPPLVELRLIPRSNFLAERSPLPLNQGMRGWFWTGHHAWTDELAPASLLYGNRVSSRRNWEWSLNEAQILLEATATPDELLVHLDTVTPSFDTFTAKVDAESFQPVSSGLTWKLHAGRNRIEVRSRNKRGREGPASWVVLDR